MKNVKKRKKREIYQVDEAIIVENIGKINLHTDDEKLKYNFATRLNDELVEKGITQTKLQELTGLSKGAISGYRRGRMHPTIINVNRIAKVLNVSVDYLLGNVHYKTLNKDKQRVLNYTGLSEKALQNIVNIKKTYTENQFYNMFFENENILILFEYIQDYICETNEKEKDFKLFKAEKIFRDILNTLTSE